MLGLGPLKIQWIIKRIFVANMYYGIINYGSVTSVINFVYLVSFDYDICTFKAWGICSTLSQMRKKRMDNNEEKKNG